MQKIRFYIVDDHPTFREGMARMLEEDGDFECIGTAADGTEAVGVVRRLKPDIVLMDVSLPKTRGTEVTREIKKACPSTAVIMLSAFDYESFVLASLRAGARGYILKTAPLERLKSAIRLVYNGVSVLDIKASQKLSRHLDMRGDGDLTGNMRLEILNPRELEVINGAARGLSNKEIASQLIISERTVQTHLVNIFRKLGASSRTQAVLYALREGWVSLDEDQRRARG